MKSTSCKKIAKPHILIPKVNAKCVAILEELLKDAKAGELQGVSAVASYAGGEFVAKGTSGNRFEDSGHLLYLAIHTIMA